MERTFQILGWLVMGTLILAIARQLSERRDIYLLPDSWGQQYANYGNKGILENFEANPAKADAPYKLLADVLPEKKTEGTLTAEKCYEKDFLQQSNKVGNYIQRTNNFHHGSPDSCSAPLTELVDSFYKNP